MNADQQRAIRLALDFLQKTTEEHSVTDTWTDADWAIWRKANPLQNQMERISREILADPKGRKFMEVGMSIINEEDSPFSMQKGAWGIIDDAIRRRRFFRFWRSVLG